MTLKYDCRHDRETVKCDVCHEYVDLDEIVDLDSMECRECRDIRIEKEIVYWKPLYDAEQRFKVADEDLSDYDILKLKGMIT